MSYLNPGNHAIKYPAGPAKTEAARRLVAHESRDARSSIYLRSRQSRFVSPT